MSEVIYYIGLVLTLGGAIAYGVYLNYLIKNQMRIEKNVLFRKNIGVLQGFWLLTVLGLVFFTIAFYNDESTLNYVTNNSLVVDAGHQFLSYFFLILFDEFLFVFLTSFFFRFYIKDIEEKIFKLVKICLYSSIPLMIVTFIAFSEGNAPYLQYPLCNSIYIGKHGIRFINSYLKPSPYYNNGSIDGGVSIAFYAIFILSGAFLVLYVCDHFIYKFYGEHDTLTTCFFVAFPSGLIGARLWYVLLDISKEGSSSTFIKDPSKIIAVWDGGLGIMGGAILGIIAGVSTMLIIKYRKKDPRYQKLNYLTLVDIIVPSILVAQAIGRVGNFFNCEVHGNEIPFSSIEWLPSFVKLNYQFDYATKISDSTMAYLPLATIETFTNFIGYFYIYFGIVRGLGKYHAEGSGLGWYLVWYGATRAFLEPLRSGEFQYNMSIWSSYGMIIGGLVIVLFFVGWKFLRVKKLWIYKDRDMPNGMIIQDTRTDKELIRNAIILGVITLIIAICLIVFFTIW